MSASSTRDCTIRPRECNRLVMTYLVNGAKLGRFIREQWNALLVLWIIVIMLLTSMPWRNYVGHSHWALVQWVPFYSYKLVVRDILGNIALFVPFGFCLNYGFLTRGYGRASWVFVLCAAFVLSSAAELFQVFCHNRHPSATDVINNMMGAVLGGILLRVRGTVFSGARVEQQ